MYRREPYSSDYWFLATQSGTSRTYSSLPDEDETQVEVYAVCGSHNSSLTPAISHTPCQAPTINSVAATSNDIEAELDVDWGAITNATSYTLTYTPDGGSAQTATVTGATSTMLDNLDGGTEYTITVTAHCSNAGGLTSDASSAATETTICPQPQNLTVTSNNSNGTDITFSWDAVPGATEYKVYRREPYTSDSWFIATQSGTSRTYSSLPDDDETQVKVYAVCGSLNSSMTSATSHTPCQAPTISSVAATSNNTEAELDVDWGAITNATSYTLTYIPDGGSAQTETVTGATSTTLDNLDGATEYSITVTAHCSNAGGLTSNASNAVTETTICPIPQNLNITSNNDAGTEITFNFDAVSGATKYNIYRSKPDTTNAWLIVSESSNSRDFTVPGDEETELKVYAVCGSDISDFSSTQTHRPCTMAPVLMGAVTGSDMYDSNHYYQQIWLTWEEVPQATDYIIHCPTFIPPAKPFYQNSDGIVCTPANGLCDLVIGSIEPNSEYTIEVYAECGTVWSDKSYLTVTTGESNYRHGQASQPSNSELKLYPNPTTSAFTLAFEVEAAETAQLTITDLAGRMLVTEAVELDAGQNTLNRNEDLPAGIYLLNLKGQRINETVRLQIAR